jgi:mono/diheme cytochrome c family protein
MTIDARARALAMALLVGGWPAHVFGAEKAIQQAHAAAGQAWYDTYCTPCHGRGGAPGSAVFRVGGTPVDLRTYVHRHNGIFPAYEWIAVVEHVDLESPHAAVWEQIRKSQAGTSAERAAARGIVASIADYIVSVQKK